MKTTDPTHGALRAPSIGRVVDACRRLDGEEEYAVLNAVADVRERYRRRKEAWLAKLPESDRAKAHAALLAMKTAEIAPETEEAADDGG